ncbi:chitin-binding type-2 domain-containing protein [Trichonephila clavipes]|uniref:Chitin-binding type-2 domain-containing protein n=1 Tax=Trichonephila clavipes TaxID=2585209 RepID=A0A8X6RM12_TRICX|nr:chitin-binding type-2 domain-containing protein [Trichonephila clavipes]
MPQVWGSNPGRALIINVDESKPEETDAVISDLNLEEQSTAPIYRLRSNQNAPDVLQSPPSEKPLGYILVTPEDLKRLQNINGIAIDAPKYLTYPSGPSATNYDSSRNPDSQSPYRSRYPLGPSSETGDHYFTPRENKYPERPAPPLNSLSPNNSYTNKVEYDISNSPKYNSPSSGQYGSGDLSRPISSHGSAENTHDNTKYGGDNSPPSVSYYGSPPVSPASPYSQPQDPPSSSYGTSHPSPVSPYGTSHPSPVSPYGTSHLSPVSPYGTSHPSPVSPYGSSRETPYGTSQEQIPPYHSSYPSNKKPVSYSKPYDYSDGKNHESYSSLKPIRPSVDSGYQSPQVLSYDPNYNTATSLYSPKPRSPKFKYYTSPKYTNEYTDTSSSSVSNPKLFDGIYKNKSPEPSYSPYRSPSSEVYSSPKETYMKESPVSYGSNSEETYGSRTKYISDKVPYSNTRSPKSAYLSGPENYSSQETPSLSKGSYSTNYGSEPYRSKNPSYEGPSSYNSQEDTKYLVSKSPSSSSYELPQSSHGLYSYPVQSLKSKTPISSYDSVNYSANPTSAAHSEALKEDMSYNSSPYDTYGSRKQISNIDNKKYNSLPTLSKPGSPYRGSSEVSSPVVTRFYDTPSHSSQKSTGYSSKYPESQYEHDLPKSSHYDSPKSSKYSGDVKYPIDSSYHSPMVKNNPSEDKSTYYNEPHSPVTSKDHGSHSVSKNYKPSRPAPLYDEYEQPRYPPLPADTKDSSEKPLSYENYKESPVLAIDYKKVPETSHSSEYDPATYKSPYSYDQSSSYYPVSNEPEKNHYSEPLSKEIDDEPQVHTKTITKTYSKPYTGSSDETRLYGDHSSESPYNSPSGTDSPLSSYGSPNDKKYSYSSEPSSYSKPYSYSEPTGPSDEYSYSKPLDNSDKKFRYYSQNGNPESYTSYLNEKERPKRVEGVVYRSRKIYPDLPSPRRQKSYLPYKDYNPKSAPAIDYQVYENAPKNNFTKSPRNNSIKLTYKPLKKDSYEEREKKAPAYDNSFEDSPFSNIPGKPGKDFPILKAIPYTHFSCENRAPGFYADTQHRCQVYYQCSDKSRVQSFLCPNGTVFNQATFVCEWWHNVDCSKSEQHFAKNNELYKPNLPVSSDSVEVDKHPPSARSHGYEEYPSAEEYSGSYQNDHSGRHSIYAKAPRRSRSEVTYNTPHY